MPESVDAEVLSAQVNSMSFTNSSLSSPRRHLSLNDAFPKREQLAFQKSQSMPEGDTTALLARMRWQWAAKRVKFIADPWASFRIDNYETEACVRHQYNPIKKSWYQEECFVKMEPKKFEQGAMRACFRMLAQKCSN